MLINNAPTFNTLIGTGAPSIAWTTYDPIQNWARTELETLNPGSIVCQVTGAGVGSYQLAKVWAKRSRTAGNGEYDYIAITTTAFSGTATPVASNADLAAAPLGSYYVKVDADNVILQIYVKVNNTGSDVAVLHDWHPMILEVTRTGSAFSFDSDNYSLNVPISGDLVDNGDGTFTWTPDDGGDAIDIPIPIFTDNEDGTYTYDPNDGTAPITVTATVPDIPADISGVNRPWVKEGAAEAVNATNIGSGDAIFHEGTMVRGATAIGGTNVQAELRGNTALGNNDSNLTGSNNCLAVGEGITLTNTANGVVSGDNNTVDDADSCAIFGQSHTVAAGSSYAFIGGGVSNKAGLYGATLGGRFAEALGASSVAIGLKAQVSASHAYAVLINTMSGADPNTDTDPFNSAAGSEFAVRCNGIRFFTNLAETAGMTMAAGASAWVAVSDERTKQNIEPLVLDILTAYKRLQVVKYQQGSDNIGAGVTAQNFYAAFDWLPIKRIGEMFAINQMEHDGVQDAAIGQLIAVVERLTERVNALEAKLAQP